MATAGRAACRGGALRQAVAADEGVVHRRHRRTRRAPARHRHPDHASWPGRGDRRRRPGVVPPGRGDRVADVRAGPHRGPGLGLSRAGDQRAHRPVPPLPGPGGPADDPGALRLAGRPHADLPRRWLGQHVAFVPTWRGDRRDARAHRRSADPRTRLGRHRRGHADRRADRGRGRNLHRSRRRVRTGRRDRHRRLGLHGPGSHAGGTASDPRAVSPGWGQAGAGQAGLPGAALPAGAPW